MYWTDRAGNIYGPFDAQGDGYPDAGQVVKHYRKKQGYSARQFAKMIENVSVRWIYQMEQKNEVPDSMSRRRMIATLLNIPPFLLGLAAFHDIRQKEPVRAQTIHADIDMFTTMLPALWASFHAGVNPITLEGQVQAAIDRLAGSTDTQTLALLAKYYRLSSLLERDERNIQAALAHIEQAEKIACEIGDVQLRAVGLLTHGRILVEADNPQEARRFFAAIHDLIGESTSSLAGTTMIELAMAWSQLAQDREDARKIERLIDKVGDIAYSKLAEDESYTKLNPGLFHGYQALSYLQLGMHNSALDAIEEASILLPPEQTRREARIDIIQARLAFATGELYTCAACLEKAYTTSIQIRSLYNLHLIETLVSDIRQSKHASEKIIRETLARMKSHQLKA
ncbi:MAG: helix-turn-helix transcriptional regulator [Ktedonobacteraceae bacterium]|nr:helix-turn-helix transcriptional regulator [Ktedonobacteraceae bacterium]